MKSQKCNLIPIKKYKNKKIALAITLSIIVGTWWLWSASVQNNKDNDGKSRILLFSE